MRPDRREDTTVTLDTKDRARGSLTVGFVLSAETYRWQRVTPHQKRWQAAYFAIICTYPVDNHEITSLYNVGRNFI